VRDGYQGTTTPYKIDGGKVITFVSQDPYSLTFYKLGTNYYAARNNEFGYANYQIIPAPQIALNPLTAIANQFSTELALTQDQKEQIIPILKMELTELGALKKDPAFSGPQKLEELRRIGASFDEKLKPLLNPDQQSKFQALREALRRRMLVKMAGEVGAKLEDTAELKAEKAEQDLEAVKERAEGAVFGPATPKR